MTDKITEARADALDPLLDAMQDARTAALDDGFVTVHGAIGPGTTKEPRGFAVEGYRAGAIRSFHRFVPEEALAARSSEPPAAPAPASSPPCPVHEYGAICNCVPEARQQRWFNGHDADCRKRGGAERFVGQYPCSCGLDEALAAAPAPASPEPDDDENYVEPPSPKIWEGLPVTRSAPASPDEPTTPCTAVNPHGECRFGNGPAKGAYTGWRCYREARAASASVPPPLAFHVTNQCGDCGFVSEDSEDFRRHHRRKMHRNAIRRAAAETPEQPASREAGEPA